MPSGRKSSRALWFFPPSNAYFIIFFFFFCPLWKKAFQCSKLSVHSRFPLREGSAMFFIFLQHLLLLWEEQLLFFPYRQHEEQEVRCWREQLPAPAGSQLGSACPQCQRAPSQGTEPAQLVSEPMQAQGRKDGKGEERERRKLGPLPVCLLPPSPTRGDSSRAGPTTLLDYPNCVCSCRPVARSCQWGYK